jgi:hypothetical protein
MAIKAETCEIAEWLNEVLTSRLAIVTSFSKYKNSLEYRGEIRKSNLPISLNSPG